VLWALRTNINRATNDTPFNLVYGADASVSMLYYLLLHQPKGLISPTAKTISLKKEMDVFSI
jgi:hypothetical protein